MGSRFLINSFLQRQAKSGVWLEANNWITISTCKVSLFEGCALIELENVFFPTLSKEEALQCIKIEVIGTYFMKSEACLKISIKISTCHYIST